MPKEPDAPLVSDDRRPPFCYQTHDALDAICGHAVFTRARRSTALAVYLVLTEAANRSGGAAARAGFEIERKWLADRVALSLDSLDLYLKDLAAVGVVEIVKQRHGKVHLPNRYRLIEPERDRSGSPPSRTESATPSRTGSANRARESETTKKEDEEVPTATAVGADEQPTPDPAAAQRLVGFYVDECRKLNSNPPDRVKGQYAREIAKLLAEGITPRDVAKGLRLSASRGLHPAALASALHEARLEKRPRHGGLTAAELVERGRSRGDVRTDGETSSRDAVADFFAGAAGRGARSDSRGLPAAPDDAGDGDGV